MRTSPTPPVPLFEDGTTATAGRPPPHGPARRPVLRRLGGGGSLGGGRCLHWLSKCFAFGLLLSSLCSLLFYQVFARLQQANSRTAWANLLQGWRAMSRSVWTAPYSGALTSGAPLYQRFCKGFAKALQIPAHPATGKCLSISILQHDIGGLCPAPETHSSGSCQPQLTGDQHVANAGTRMEFVRFVPKTSHPPRSPLLRRQFQMPCTQQNTHAGTRRTLSGNQAGWGDKLPTCRADLPRRSIRAKAGVRRRRATLLAHMPNGRRFSPVDNKLRFPALPPRPTLIFANRPRWRRYSFPAPAGIT
jgi:hypothetical protein